MDHNKLIHQLLRYTLLLKSKYDCNITAAAAESKFFNLDLDFFEVFSINLRFASTEENLSSIISTLIETFFLSSVANFLTFLAC